MKKPNQVYSRGDNNNPEDNLLLAIVMGGIGVFTGFLIWFIMPASFGISALTYMLLSFLLAAGFFTFGLMQPEKSIQYLDKSWEFIVKRIRKLFKLDKKTKK